MNPKDKFIEKERKILPFFIEFVKFSAAFAVIIAAALLVLNIATASAL